VRSTRSKRGIWLFIPRMFCSASELDSSAFTVARENQTREAKANFQFLEYDSNNKRKTTSYRIMPEVGKCGSLLFASPIGSRGC
jgi:hypothetical protein